MKWLIGLILIICIIPLANAHETPFGYEFLNNGKVLNMWNPSLDYYFNTTSGLQFTNNYNDYWSKNIFCIGFRNATTGIWDDKCNDGTILNTFSWKLYTDNLTYVSVQGFKNISISGKQIEVGLNYSLDVLQNDLTIRPSLKNVDTTNITNEIRFIWRVQDIAVDDQYNNFLQANNTEINLSRNWNITSPVFPKEYMIYKIETGKWFRVRWDYAQHKLKVASELNQFNAPVTLYLNDTRLNVNQTKATNLYWIDALCLFKWHSNTPTDFQHLIDDDDIRIVGGCVNQGGNCPVSQTCPTNLEVGVRREGASAFTTLTSGDLQIYACNTYLTNIYTFKHNNKTDERLCVRTYNDDENICVPNANCFASEERTDVWLNNHTPTTHNVTIQIFNDTYINLDGADDYVNASKSNNYKLRDFLNNYTLTGWTFIGWARTRNTIVQQAIISQGDNGGTGRTWILFRPSACSTRIGTNFNGVNVCTNVTPNPNTWYQVALTYNTTATRIYINGSLMNITVNNPDENALGDVLFGVSKTIAQDFNGSIDNFMFYNRTLEQPEIDLYFNNGSGRITNPNINQTDLQVWYSMDEGFGMNTTDRINLYLANLTNDANWTNLGTAGIYCPYSFQDLDSDLQNSSMPPPYVKWFLNGNNLNSLFNNQLFIYTTEEDYNCCIKPQDNVYATGNEQFTCNSQLDQDFLQGIFIGIIAFSFALIYLATKLNKKHNIVSHLFILVAGFLLWVFINMLRFYTNENFINGISSAYMIALLLFGFFIIIEVLTGIIKAIK